MKKPFEKYSVSADKKHLYCYTRIWGDKDDTLCVLLHYPTKKGFDPDWNRWAKLAKQLNYGGIRITFCYTEIPLKLNTPKTYLWKYEGTNNAKSAVIRNKALLSSISLIMKTELYETNDKVMLEVYKKAAINFKPIATADDRMELIFGNLWKLPIFKTFYIVKPIGLIK